MSNTQWYDPCPISRRNEQRKGKQPKLLNQNKTKKEIAMCKSALSGDVKCEGVVLGSVKCEGVVLGSVKSEIVLLAD